MTNWDQVNTALAALPGYAEQVGAIRAETDQAIATIKATEMFSDRYKDQEITKAKEAATSRLQTLRTSIGFQVDQIDRNRPAPLGSDDPMAEFKLSRAATRVNRMLDGGVPVQTVIRAAVQAQDPLMVMALREDFPSRIWSQTLDMDQASRDATIEHFHQSLALAVATGFPGSDEGRWLAAKMQSDLLSQIAQTKVRMATAAVQEDRSDSEMLDAISVSLLQRDLAKLQTLIADGSLSFETRQLSDLEAMSKRVTAAAENG